MADAFMDKFSALGERLKVSGSGLSKKMSAGVTSVSGKMKELFQVPTPADKVVEDATSETLLAGDLSPDWERYLHVCDMVNHGQMSGQDIARAIKKRLAASGSSPTTQLLTLCLLETCVKNCEKMFSEVASERVLDDMVRVIDDPQTAQAVRDKTLMLIESWGELTEELRYLPVFEETHKSLRARGIRFPSRDSESLAPIFTPARSYASEPVRTRAVSNWESHVDFSPEQTKEIFDVARNSMELLSTVLTSSPQQEVLKEELATTLVEQCRQSQYNIQKVIERGGDEVSLFEALNLNDGLLQVLSKYEEMLSSVVLHSNRPSEPALIPVGVVDEEEPSIASGENSLVRKSSAKPSSFSSFQAGESADLDNMLFGQTGASTQENAQHGSKKKNNNLIAF